MKCSLVSTAAVCLLLASTATRMWSGTRKSNQRNPLINRSLQDDSLLAYADFGIKIVKWSLKIAGKSVKQLAQKNPFETRSWKDLALGPNAFVVYTLCIGTLYMTYCEMREQKFEGISFAGRVRKTIDSLIDTSSRITKCYGFISFAGKFIQRPGKYAIPFLFASAMVGINSLSSR